MTAQILVVGDLIYDRWVHGTCQRMSPEAACPVFVPDGRMVTQWGGAGAVAWMAAELDAAVSLMGCCGRLPHERMTRPVEIPGVVFLGNYDATKTCSIKTRMVTPTGQVLRIDEESLDSWKYPEGWLDMLSEACHDADMVLVADYGKGVISNALMKRIVAASERIIVDPARGTHPDTYLGCWGIKPNFPEWLAFPWDAWPGNWQLVTNDGRGMTLTHCVDGGDDREVSIPARYRQVSDPCGAGDQVLATLGVLLAEGMELEEACRWANGAAGLQVERAGIVPVTRVDLDCDKMESKDKIVDLEAFCQAAKIISAAGKKIIFTNGCFDLFHAGHLHCLEEAKKLGGALLVGVNSNWSYHAIRGRDALRPMAERAGVVAALECVDGVTIFQENDACRIIEAIKPDIYVKGWDCEGKEFPERQAVAKVPGCKMYFVSMLGNESSTGIRKQLSEAVKDDR